VSGADRVVVLDRDGTIVVDREYLADPDGLEFLPGAAEGLRRLHRQGYRLVVISNQSGVGRGLFTLERLRQINDRLMQMVGQAGAQLTAIYCCPHRPEEQCDCRKPRAALLHQAARELGFDPHTCIVVGDQSCDVELGQHVGATTVLISADPAPAAAHYVATDLLQAARIIERLDPCT
jgi:D-glycero-D-manno-heptose 1,7-bisphosphate phosphatase